MMKCLSPRIHCVGRRAQSKTSVYAAVLLYLTALLPATSAATHSPSLCRQIRNFKLCELPEDLPQDPFDWGDPVDRNVSRPSEKLLLDHYYSHVATDRQQQPQQQQQQQQKQQKSSSSFSADFVGNPSASARLATNFCMQRAAENWLSTVPVTVRVNFTNLGDTLILGTGQPSRNWIVNDYICSVALSEAVVEQDLNKDYSGTSKYDILMTLNTGASWYYGLDAKPPPGKYDLVTVCLHEVYHGLFMSGGNIGISFNKVDLTYSAIYLRETQMGRFDSFMANQDGCKISGYKDNPAHLGTALTGNNLWFVSESAPVAKLYAPRPYTLGSSLYHLSEAEYGSNGDQNGLMTPAIGSNYGQHNPGDVVLLMQNLVLDLEGKSGADACASIRPPEVDNTTVEQDAGDDSNPDRDGGVGGSSGFKLRFGDTEVSGWVVVGAAAAAVVLILVVALVTRVVLSPSRKGGKGGRPKRPERRVREQVNFVDGGNGGGIV